MNIQEKSIIALEEEFEIVKASGKLQKILNFKWELSQQYSRLIQEGNKLDWLKQYKYSQKAYDFAREIYKLEEKTRRLLK